MSVDYIVGSLPTLAFDAPAPLSAEQFAERVPDAAKLVAARGWTDLETQLRNAMAEARGGAKWCRPATGCSLYWKNRAMACFAEKDVAKREELVDRVFWDAAEELTDVSDPLGEGALATYAVRLGIALRRSRIAKDRGNAAFDRLTSETKMKF